MYQAVEAVWAYLSPCSRPSCCSFRFSGAACVPALWQVRRELQRHLQDAGTEVAVRKCLGLQQCLEDVPGRVADPLVALRMGGSAVDRGAGILLTLPQV